MTASLDSKVSRAEPPLVLFGRSKDAGYGSDGNDWSKRGWRQIAPSVVAGSCLEPGTRCATPYGSREWLATFGKGA